MTRTHVETANTGDLPLSLRMRNVDQRTVNGYLARIADAVEQRAEKDPQAAQSNDFDKLRDWTTSENIARMFAALHIDPSVYILQPFMDDTELVNRGFDPIARTRNLKAYKKVREVAEYIATGTGKLEAVFKTFTACALIASKSTKVIHRDVATRFLNSIPMDDVSADLSEAIEAYRARHMTGGAETQSTQCMLTLANLGAGRMVPDGKRKHFALDLASPVTVALADRFGLSEYVNA